MAELSIIPFILLLSFPAVYPTEFTCGDLTSEKVLYFTNPESGIQRSCNLIVNVDDSSVTQLRLDFKTFSIAQPTSKTKPTTETAYFCNVDKFSVTGTTDLGFDNLCGENTGQHIYIPVDASLSPASIKLQFTLGDRSHNIIPAHPTWRIKITQIDCHSPDTRDQCAPPGCLQYYPDESGRFESFNFHDGVGNYQGRLNYAICFKKNPEMCSIQYKPVKFQLAANNLEYPYGVSGCNMASDPYFPSSQDHLFIPDGHFESSVNSSMYCGDGIQNTVTSNSPGPMAVYFRTDAVADRIVLGEEKGFQINYEQSSFDCYGTAAYNAHRKMPAKKLRI